VYYLTDDPDNFDLPAKNFLNAGYEVLADIILKNFELPDWFPMNSYLQNIGY